MSEPSKQKEQAQPDQSFKTAQKRPLKPSFPLSDAPTHLPQTVPLSARQSSHSHSISYIIQSVSLLQLKHLCPLAFSDPTYSGPYRYFFSLVGIITSITPTSTTYNLTFTESTSTTSNLLFVSRPNDKFSQIQFQSNDEEGQPYFRIVVVPHQQGWKVVNVQKVRQMDMISYHWSKAMYQLAMNQKQRE